VTRKTQFGIVLAGLFFALVGFTVGYRLKMTDHSGAVVHAPAYEPPLLYEDGTLAKAEAAFQAELQKPLGSIPKDDPLVTALVKEFPKPEPTVAPADVTKPVEATPASFSSSADVQPIPPAPLAVTGSTPPATPPAPTGNLPLPQAGIVVTLPPPLPANSFAITPPPKPIPIPPPGALVNAAPPVPQIEELGPPKLSPQTNAPPLHGTTSPVEPPVFPGVVMPPSTTPQPPSPAPMIVTSPSLGFVNPGYQPVTCVPVTASPPARNLPLTGTHPALLNEKNRVVLTNAMLEHLDDARTLFMHPGHGQCLSFMTAEQLNAQMLQLEADGRGDDKTRRLFFARTERVIVEPDGALTLAANLVSLAGLGHDIVIIGVGDHFEIWDAGRWKQYSNAETPKEIKQTSEIRLSMPVSN
jgi:division/cell wall cluster transcriptional repressor MraZ